MARQTIWVLALLVSCAVESRLSAGTGQQARPTATPNAAAKDSKDHKDNKAATPGKPDERERWKWWLYDRAELGISDQQSRDINEVFESTLPRLRDTRHELDKAEEDMGRTIKEHKADLAVVSGQIDRLENARSQHNKTRTLMLYRMHLLLSPEQRTKLEALRARRDADRPPPPGFRRRP